MSEEENGLFYQKIKLLAATVDLTIPSNSQEMMNNYKNLINEFINILNEIKEDFPMYWDENGNLHSKIKSNDDFNDIFLMSDWFKKNFGKLLEKKAIVKCIIDPTSECTTPNLILDVKIKDNFEYKIISNEKACLCQKFLDYFKTKLKSEENIKLFKENY